MIYYYMATGLNEAGQRDTFLVISYHDTGLVDLIDTFGSMFNTPRPLRRERNFAARQLRNARRAGYTVTRLVTRR